MPATAGATPTVRPPSGTKTPGPCAAGVFDLSATPAGGNSPNGGVLDSTFQQYALVAEIEKRYELWGQPGKFKVTGFLNRGRAGKFQDAITLAQVTGDPADITAVRRYTGRPGVSMNLEQQISDTVGVFARAGWADGKVEPWDFTDIDRTVAGGVSINGKNWGRPDDTVGIAGVVNNISGVQRRSKDVQPCPECDRRCVCHPPVHRIPVQPSIPSNYRAPRTMFEGTSSG